MKKITTRAIACLFLALLLALGTALFVYRFVTDGGSWAAFPSNKHAYTDGVLNSGRILDRNGMILAEYDDGWTYADDSSVRRGTLHAVGDPGGVIGTGALTEFADKLTGYNLITGSNNIISGGRDLYLTIDGDLCATAYDALGGRDGAIGLYDYTTGEILCMVSSPGYDPASDIDVNNAAAGTFINKFTSATFIPGSTFKIVTATAALEKISDITSRTFTCEGSLDVGGYHMTCPTAHGEMTFEEALNQSCNCVFGAVAVELGSETMASYVKSLGLTSSYSINGIETAKSSFDFKNDGDEGLAWSGVGQGKDMVNPCSMMVLNGAIASGGKAATPQILRYSAFHEGVRNSIYIKHYTDKLIDSDTATTLREYMRTDVINNYGQDNFPDLDICAKSGTAQTGGDEADTSWFVGFLDDESHPLAFAIVVEGGGSGAGTAGRIANTVLQAAVKAGY